MRLFRLFVVVALLASAAGCESKVPQDDPGGGSREGLAAHLKDQLSPDGGVSAMVADAGIPPTITETVTATQTATATATSTGTVPATVTNTNTVTVTSTGTSVQTLTHNTTVTVTGTNTTSSTGTQTATATSTSTGTQTYTATATATGTQTLTTTTTVTNTVTSTVTKTVTNTTTSTATQTATGSSTQTKTQTATGSKSYTATGTLTLTFTGTKTGTQTSSGAVSGTKTATGTATWTGSYLGTGTGTGTRTLTGTLTGTTTVTGRLTLTATGTATHTGSTTATASATASASGTTTQTYTVVPTVTVTNSTTSTGTSTSTSTSTVTATATHTSTATGTIKTSTLTKTVTNTLTTTNTTTVTNTGTATNSHTATSTGTYTQVQTVTNSNTQTQTTTATGSKTAILTSTVTNTTTATNVTTIPNPCVGSWAFCDNFENGTGAWTVRQGPVQNFTPASDGTKVYSQSDSSASTLYISQAGSAWMDSTVEASLKPVKFSSNTSSAMVTLWGHYDSTWGADCGYYVGLDGDGTVSLGKRVAGVNTSLGSPVPVSGGITAGTWYDVKLEMIGTTINAYVGGTLLLTQTDTSCDGGSVGVGSVGAAFEADNVEVTAPSTNSCVQNWRTTACGAFCTYEKGVQSDRAGCDVYLDCYAAHGCSPETCGGPDDVCGVNVLNPWGTASKEVADQVYKCMGCRGSVDCTNAKYYNGTVCADGSACTFGDTCQNKVCTPDPNRNTQCNASDQCHDVGTCDTTSGICSNPSKQDGTACDDGNPCTSGDQCSSGSCTAGQPVTCEAPPNCDPPVACDPSNGGCAEPTGCVGAGPEATALYSETWDSGSADGWRDLSGNLIVPATDSTSPDGPGVQWINTTGTTYQPDAWTTVQPGSYCVAAYVRWASGSWPFIGIQVNYSSGTTETDWLIGQGSYAQSQFGPVTPVSATDQSWQYLNHTVVLPTGVTQVRLVDELWNGASKGGSSDSAYFDGLSINSGPCQSGPPETIYQEWWESGDSNWSDDAGNPAKLGSDPSSPAGSTVQVIDQSSSSASYSSPQKAIPGGATICVWSSVRWVSGEEPFVGVKLGAQATATMLVGGDGASANLSTTDLGWQTFGVTVNVPTTPAPVVSVQIVDGVSTSSTNVKQGGNGNLSYFDNMSITAGPCQGRPTLEPQIVPSSTIIGSSAITPGRIDGTFAVTDNGDATYRIPLWVPPGVNGVQPNLALAYSSDGGDGVMGLGWHVDGFSRISRCPKDWARDSQRQAIQFDDTDPLCLDGERLVLISDQQNQANPEYRTENDKHIKIVQVDHDNLGPTGFLAYFPDGTRRSYGKSTSTTLDGFSGGDTAVMEANRVTITASDTDESIPVAAYDTPARLAWALASSRDRYDNQVTYSYTVTDPSPDDGHAILDFRPSKVAYGDRQVVFAYDENNLVRQDIRDSFVNGLPLRTGHLLTSITMNLSGAVVLRSYQLGYQNDPTRALLKAVKECDSVGTCKPATTFDWTASEDNFQQVKTGLKDHVDFGTIGTTPTQNNAGVFFVGDFNADGFDEVGYDSNQYAPSTTGYRDVALRQDPIAGVFSVSQPQYLGFSPLPLTAGNGVRVADLNGDAVADMIVPSVTGVFVANNSSNNDCAGIGVYHYYPSWCPSFCSVNASCSSGFPAASSSPDDCNSGWCVGNANGWGTSSSDGLLTQGKVPMPLVGDLNGDGLPEIIRPFWFQNQANPIWSYRLTLLCHLTRVVEDLRA